MRALLDSFVQGLAERSATLGEVATQSEIDRGTLSLLEHLGY
jgi:hypothetical protein